MQVLYDHEGTSQGFVREGYTSFMLDIDQLPPLRPGGDCDQDGIPDAHEPEGDFDFDGLPNVCDGDADGDDIPDGRDDSIELNCDNDTVGPRITLNPATLYRSCNPDAQWIQFTPPAVEDHCGTATIAGVLIAARGQSLSEPVAMTSTFDLRLHPGEATIRWTGTDELGNTSFVDQVFTIDFSEGPHCCDANQTLIEGTALQDAIVRTDATPYCVLSYQLGDFVSTGSSTDQIRGAEGGDHLNGRGGTDVLFGGDGSDMVNCSYGEQAEIHAGSGQDHLQLFYCSGTELWGGSGGDAVIGSPGVDEIYPGSGVDSVAAGSGADIITLFHHCEATPGKIIDGGLGFDTVVSPYDATTLASLGVTVVNVEQFVVDTNQGHLAECF